MQRLHLPEGAELALSAALQLLHLVDRRRVGAEAVAPVNQHDGLGDALQVDRPVEGGVAAADEEDALALELLRIEHLEVEPLLLVPLLALDAQAPRLERPDARRDDDRPRRKAVGAVSSTKWPPSVTSPPTRRRPMTTSPKWVGAELERLRGHVPHQVLGQHLGKARDVEDVLLRVERHELAAKRRQGVDDAGRGAAHPRIERREEAGRSSADNRDVLELVLRHCHSHARGEAEIEDQMYIYAAPIRPFPAVPPRAH